MKKVSQFSGKRALTFLFVVGLFIGCEAEVTEAHNDDHIIDGQLLEESYSPADLNNELMTMMEGTIDLVDELFMADSSNIVSTKENLLFEISIHRGRIKNLDFELGGDAFKAAVDDLLAFYEAQFKTDFNGVQEVLLKGEWSKAEDEILVNFDEAFALEEEVLYDHVIDEQEAFAAAYKIQLVDRNF